MTVVLTDEHRRAIAETLVGRNVELERVYRQLEYVLEGYQVLERNQPQSEFKAVLKRRRRQRELISELLIMRRDDHEAMLKSIQENPAAAHDEEEDEEDELARNQVLLRREETWLATLEEMQQQAEARIGMLESLDQGFHRKANLWKKNLYENVLQIWQNTIKGKLTYSRSWEETGENEPFGPLIEFFTACLKPVLGSKMPGPYGIAAIIDGVRASGFGSECRPRFS